MVGVRSLFSPRNMATIKVLSPAAPRVMLRAAGPGPSPAGQMDRGTEAPKQPELGNPSIPSPLLFPRSGSPAGLVGRNCPGDTGPQNSTGVFPSPSDSRRKVWLGRKLATALSGSSWGRSGLHPPGEAWVVGSLLEKAGPSLPLRGESTWANRGLQGPFHPILHVGQAGTVASRARTKRAGAATITRGKECEGGKDEGAGLWEGAGATDPASWCLR